MKKIWVALVFLVLAVNVSAMTANITIVSDDVYTGAILKLRSLGSEELGDSYYPVFVGKNVGIVKFEVETGLSEVNLSLRFTDNGAVCLNIEKGPFAINGSDIIVDLRETPDIIVAEEEVKNISKEVVEETIPKIEDEEAIEINKEGLVGYASKDYSILVQNNVYFLVGLDILFTGLFSFFIIRSAYKSGAKAELKALGRIELDKKLDKLKD